MARAILLSAFLGLGSAASESQDDWPILNEIPAKQLKRLGDLARAGDWKGVFELYEQALDRYPDRLARDPKDPYRYVGFAEAVRARLLTLPGAEEAFQDRYDGSAAAAFREAREAGNWDALEQAADRYFLATGARDALDTAAHRRFSLGDAGSAAVLWQKLLQRLDASHELYPVIACRLASAYAALQDEDGLARLRTLPLNGQVQVGGVLRSAEDYIASLQFPRAAESADPVPAIVRPALDPYRPVSPSTELLLGTVNLNTDAANRTTGALKVKALYERLGDREYVVITTGRRVLAFDPSRGDGRALDGSVFWRWPEGKPIRGDTNLAVAYGAVCGLACENGVVYATLLGETAPPANPRRQPFDGPTRVVAIELRTGRLLWDTAKLRATHRNRLVPALEPTTFGDREYAFSCAPVVWQGKIYVGVSTHPQGEREAHVLCLDAGTGLPAWSAYLGAGQPRLPQQQTNLATFTTLTVDARGLFIAGNVGVVACLDPIRGTPRWSSTYTSMPVASRPMPRQASVPALFGSRVFVLAQDATEMLILDAVTGHRLPPAWNMKKDAKRIEWVRIQSLTPVAPGLLIAQGEECWRLDMAAMTMNHLIKATSCGQAEAVLTHDRLFVPCGRSASEGIALYDRSSWKYLGMAGWAQGTPGTEVVIAGDYLVVQTKQVRVYASVEGWTRRMESAVVQTPPLPDPCLRLARVLRECGRWPAAIPVFERFLLAAEGDPRWARDVEDARKWLGQVKKQY